MTTTSFASLQSSSVTKPADELLVKYQRLAEQPAETLLSEALRCLRYELDLPADERRRHIVERLYTWLAMDRVTARRIANAFAEVAAALEPSERAEVMAAEEDAVMDGLTYQEFQQLSEFMPSVRRLSETMPQPEEPKGFFGALIRALAISSPSWDY